MRALELAPHDADTVLNSAALMWEKEFKSKTGVHRDASVSSKASKLAHSVSICTFVLVTQREARQACIEFTCFTRDRDALVSWRLVQKHIY
jgi:hypothetical protein